MLGRVRMGRKKIKYDNDDIWEDSINVSLQEFVFGIYCIPPTNRYITTRYITTRHLAKAIKRYCFSLIYIYIEKDCPEFTVQQGEETQKYSESKSD